MASSTTVIFVPGAWHHPSSFDKVIQQLQSASYNTDAVHLPSVGPGSCPPSDLSADVSQIRRQIQTAVDAGQRVVLVMHSYGGIPGSEAIQGLDWGTRQRNGQPGGVVHLLFCCAFVVAEGESLMSSIGGDDRPWYRVSEDHLLVTPTTPAETFYNDLEEEEEVRAAVALLKPHSYQTFHSRVSFAGWKHVPSTYLYCLKDEAIPLAAQKMMVEDVAKGFAMRTETVDASHSPFLSVPGDVAAAIRRAAGEQVALS